MAVHPHNTPSGVNAPGLPRAGLLRSGGSECRILSHGEMLALLDGEKPELPEGQLLAADVRHSGARGRMPTHEGVVATTPYPSPIEGVSTPSTPVDPIAAPKLPDPGCVDIDMPEADRHDITAVQAHLAAARALHARRALYEAFDHGLALGDALGLSPFALDLIDGAIEFMDAVDAPDEDREPWLAGYQPPDLPLDGESDDYDNEESDFGEDDGTSEPSLAAPERHPSANDWAFTETGPHQDQRFWSDGSSHDHEQEVTDEPHDAGDDTEETLGWAANIRQVLLGPNTADGDLTAPERHGKGFVRCGPDDAEDGADAERDAEDGSDDGEDFGHFTGPRRSPPLTERERAVVGRLAGRAEKARKAAHA